MDVRIYREPPVEGFGRAVAYIHFDAIPNAILQDCCLDIAILLIDLTESCVKRTLRLEEITVIQRILVPPRTRLPTSADCEPLMLQWLQQLSFAMA